MRITLLGKRSFSLLEAFDGAGISYDRRHPGPGVMNSGEAVEILKAAAGAVPYAAVASVLITWMKLRQSRKITVTKKDGTIVHLEGFTAKELEEVLPEAKSTIAIEAGEGKNMQN